MNRILLFLLMVCLAAGVCGQERTGGPGVVNRYNGTSSNQWVQSFVSNQTNIYTNFTATISATAGTHIFTGTANCFAGWKTGYAFVPVPGDQYLVVDVNSSNSVVVQEPVNFTYVNQTNWVVYPPAIYINDINQNLAGVFASDGTYICIGFYGNTFNSGRIVLGNGTKSAITLMRHQGSLGPYFGDRVETDFMVVNNESPFNIYRSAMYDSFDILADGTCALRVGLTNGFGVPLALLSPVTISGSLNYQKNVVPKTSFYQVLASDSGVNFNNIGASGTANFNLPAAAAGLHYTFFIQNAHTVTATATGNATIRNAATVGAANGNITAATIGNVVHIVAISSTEWYVEHIIGTWTIN